jgi:hypothetical protein
MPTYSTGRNPIKLTEGSLKKFWNCLNMMLNSTTLPDPRMPKLMPSPDDQTMMMVPMTTSPRIIVCPIKQQGKHHGRHLDMHKARGRQKSGRIMG